MRPKKKNKFAYFQGKYSKQGQKNEIGTFL